MTVCCECCMLSGRDVGDEPITRSKASCRLRCAVVCDLQTSRKGRPCPAMGRSATGQKVVVHVGLMTEVRKVFQPVKN